jgi:hypothetical protein
LSSKIAIQLYLINAIETLKKAIKIEFVPYKKHQHPTSGQANGQPTKVDNGIKAVFTEVAKSNFDGSAEHVKFFFIRGEICAKNTNN